MSSSGSRTSLGLRAALAAALLLAAGCRPAPGDTPPLRVLAVSEAMFESILAEATSLGLTGLDPQGRVVPGLAQSWRVSGDGLFIVFRLRPDESAGRPGSQAVARFLTARAQADDEAGRLLHGVVAVRAPLPDVVELELSTPQPEVLELLAQPGLAIPGAQPPFVAEAPAPGTDSAPARARRLTRNPAYHAAAEVLPALALVERASPADALRRFLGGAADLVLGGGRDGWAGVLAAGRRDALLVEPERATLLLAVNHDHPWLGQRAVRLALAQAVDRGQLVARLYGGVEARPVTRIAPPVLSRVAPPPPDWSLFDRARRVEEGRRLLAEAGMPPGERLRLTVATIDTGDLALLQLLAEAWAPLGVDIVAERRSAESHRRLLADGGFELALDHWSTPVDSAAPFFWPLICGARPWGVCLTEADRLFLEGWRAPTLAERQAAWAAAERLWSDDVAVIPLIQPARWALARPAAGGIAPNPAGARPLRFIDPPVRRGLQRDTGS